MSWQGMMGGLLPWLGGEEMPGAAVAPYQAAQPLLPTAMVPGAEMQWLYEWEEAEETDKTQYVDVVWHIPFTASAGHPWCNKGYGDSMKTALSQLMKSEVALMLSNAASNLDNKTGGLLWDEEKGTFVASNVEDGGRTDTGVVIPFLASLFSKFFDNNSMGSKMRSVTDTMCQLSDAEYEAKLFEDSVYFCFMEDLVAATLICGESQQNVTCPKVLKEHKHTDESFPSTACVVANQTLHKGKIPNKVEFEDDDQVLPLLLVDMLGSTEESMLPRYIPTSISAKESFTYLLLFRSCIIAASFSRDPYLCGADKLKAPVLVPGWNLAMVVSVMEEGEPLFFEKDGGALKHDAVPLAFLSQSSIDPCSFLITVRGTATMTEWFQDFEYWHTPFFLDPRIYVHLGFMRILAALMPPLDQFIREQSLLNHCKCSDTRIYITGHSLGAGVAQLIALHFAIKYASGTCPLDISAVVFAPPRVFNDYGSSVYRQVVNGRVVLDSGDGLSYMPCYSGNSKHGWSRCSRGHMPSPGKGRDFYTENFGIVEIAVDYVEQKGGTTLDTLMQALFPAGDDGSPSIMSTLVSKMVAAGVPGLGRIPSLGTLGASHVCSAACKFGQAACGFNFRWWCDKCPMLI